MAKWRWIFLLGGLGCSPVRKIPAPDPPPSVLPPIQARAHYVRGQIWLARGNLEHAQIAFDRARVFDPKSPQILHAMSRVALNSGDTEMARKKMADAALVGGEEPEYWLEHGRLEMAFGERKVAINALKRAVSLGAGWQAKAALIADGLRHEGRSGLLDDWVEVDISDPAERRRRADLRLMGGSPLRWMMSAGVMPAAISKRFWRRKPMGPRGVAVFPSLGCVQCDLSLCPGGGAGLMNSR